MRRLLAVILALVGLASAGVYVYDHEAALKAPAQAQVGVFEYHALDHRAHTEGHPSLVFPNPVGPRHMIVLGILLAALLSLLLSFRTFANVPGDLLRDSLALGAGTLGYALAVHPLLNLPMPWNLIVAATTAAGMFLSLWLFGRFAASYPRQISGDQLHSGKWEWSRLARNRRELGLSWWRVVVDDLRNSKPLASMFRFLAEPRAPEPGSLSAQLMDSTVHRILQSRAWLLSLCLLPATAEVLRLVGSYTPIATIADAGVLLTGHSLVLIFWGIIPAIVYLPACTGYFQHNYLHGNDAERRSIRWWLVSIYTSVLIYAVLSLAFIPLIIATDVFGMPEALMKVAFGFPTWLVPGAWFMLLVAIAASIFLRGAVEPSLILSRAVLYGLIVLLMTVTFVTVESILQTQVIATFGFPDQVGIVVTGTVVALLLGPLRNRLEKHISRLVSQLIPDETHE